MKLKNAINKKAKLSARQMKKMIEQELNPMKEVLKKYFYRSESQALAFAYFKGLISKTERKNTWQLAEQSGYKDPYALQRFLRVSPWSPDELRDGLRTYTVDHLGTQESVVSVDETGFLKKGKKSAGVARQYSGTAGRIENSQIGVFLAYTTEKGRALIDRELYIPEKWFEDPERCREAGIPETVQFKTKPQLAQEMLKRAFENNVKPVWVVGDVVYGCHSLRAWLEEQEQAYVLAIPSNYPVQIGFEQYQASNLLKTIATQDWKTISVGQGTKGDRYYQWYRIQINSDSPDGWHRWLIIRRALRDKDDVAFYIGFSPDSKSLEDSARAVGSRWTIEECFEMAKGEVGLGHYEVRSWTGWYRHITLALFALSFLTKLRHQFNQRELKLVGKKTQHKENPMKQFLLSRGLV